ncbi:hypothetical protein [Psychrobium sp. 1_MG-2023]|uniref:hypothetical protein n=1 Tax=Psychrobium sp. 1_MG-2023 TaxID=3062624 RepID=UPI000C339748|nr:hypothetical protein [Psychrobium sp. 1_MG-2023]MDP2562574.1 hypothetical protein [Psychrobium sp. 1_MG-2023]PKF59659.1 hypothetical protein CW748_00155 [Alteromonadales bacterium alter-6D02]
MNTSTKIALALTLLALISCKTTQQSSPPTPQQTPPTPPSQSASSPSQPSSAQSQSNSTATNKRKQQRQSQSAAASQQQQSQQAATTDTSQQTATSGQHSPQSSEQASTQENDGQEQASDNSNEANGSESAEQTEVMESGSGESTPSDEIDFSEEEQTNAAASSTNNNASQSSSATANDNANANATMSQQSSSSVASNENSATQIPTAAAIQTTAERAAQLEEQLARSMGDYDAMILKEREYIEGKGNEQGSEAEVEVADIGSLYDDVLNGQSESKAPVAQKNGVGNQTMPAGSGNANVPGKSKQQQTYTPPADIPTGVDDDVVARQIREAALKEPDPALREKLWQEYRKYKKNQ